MKKALITLLSLALTQWLSAQLKPAAKADGSNIEASPFLNALGGTTAGRALFTLPNPSAITFPRVNADNTATLLSAASYKTALSLNNVDNTSDANKPISTATQTALNGKATTAQGTKADRASAKMFYPEDYGAVGDGSTNDDSALQSCSNAAASAGGGTIVLSKLYGLTNGFTISKGWIKVQGFSGGGYYEDGLPTCGFKMLGSTTVAITVQSGAVGKTNRGLAFRDFSIVGVAGYSGTTTRGIDFKYLGGGYGIPADCPIIDRVNFQWLSLAIRTDGTDSLTITNSRICDNVAGIFNKNAINTVVSGNIIYDHSATGCEVQGTSYGFSFVGNACGRDNTGLLMNTGQSANISGNCWTYDDSGTGTKMDAVKILYGGANSRVNIVGNTFVATTASGGATRIQGSLISITHSDNVFVSGNTFTLLNSSRPTIYLYNTNNVTVSGNYFTPGTLVPISTDDSNYGLSYSGNIHYGTNDFKTAVRATQDLSGLPVKADNASCTTALTNSTTTNGSPTVTVSSTTGLYPGMSVSGTGIPTNTSVIAILTGTTLKLSQNATNTASTTTLTFALKNGTPYQTSTGELRIKY